MTTPEELDRLRRTLLALKEAGWIVDVKEVKTFNHAGIKDRIKFEADLFGPATVCRAEENSLGALLDRMLVLTGVRI